MKSLWKRIARSAILAGVCVAMAGSVNAQDSEQPGVVRISRPRTNGPVTQVNAMMGPGCTVTNGGQSCIAGQPQAAASQSCPGTGCPTMGCPSMDCQSMSPMMGGGMYNGDCYGGNGKYHRADWRYSNWNNNYWGSGFHRRCQAQSLTFDRMYCRSTGCHPSMYYHDASGGAMMDYLKCKFGYFIPTGGGGQGVPWVGHYGRVYPVNPQYTNPKDGQIWAAEGYGIPMAVPLAPVVGHTYEFGWGVPSSRLVPVSHPAY